MLYRKDFVGTYTDSAEYPVLDVTVSMKISKTDRSWGKELVSIFQT